MPPEWCCLVPLGLEEKNGRDMVHLLNEVFTDEESADRMMDRYISISQCWAYMHGLVVMLLVFSLAFTRSS